MILERGDMWSVFGKTDLFLITTNPVRRKDGAIVMGRGIAKQMKDRFPDLPYKFAERYSEACFEQAYDDALIPTYWGMIDEYDEQLVGWFMVKDHWKEQAKLSIIEHSTEELTRFVLWMIKNKPDYRVDLNFPGIGNGKLKREDVLPVIEQLPDNVHVWEYE